MQKPSLDAEYSKQANSTLESSVAQSNGNPIGQNKRNLINNSHLLEKSKQFPVSLKPIKSSLRGRSYDARNLPLPSFRRGAPNFNREFNNTVQP